MEAVIGSIREPGDFSGLPVIRDEETRFAPPRWARRLAAAGSGLLFLDELTTAPPAATSLCPGGQDRRRREPAGHRRGRLGAVGAPGQPTRAPGLAHRRRQAAGRAIGLRPADAAALAADGSDAFDVLRRWWDAGVPRDEAASWLVAGFAPDEAARARADGATAERAAVLRALGGAIGPADAGPDR